MHSIASRSTRSSKTSRNEGLITRSSKSNHNIATNNVTRHNKPQEANTSKKRPRDSVNGIKDDLPIKKARYAVEIESRPISILSKTRSVVVDRSDAKPDILQATPTTLPQQQLATQQASQSPKPTIHHQKVANGIKHELDRLQPSEADTKDEKRKLRSQEGTRFKSELSLYFPEYDEVIGNDPKEDRTIPATT